ncbi:uncharacterized protein [Argopecten irradians]|uniref:uncharacterized protein n=1 Tax=Argopecten irradians TaxID=31199 RepID=UPI0037208923
MLVYKDLMTGTEFVSDSYPITLDDPHPGMIKIKCCNKKEDGVGDYDIGANASQEEEQEELQEAEGKVGVNVVLDFKLEETTMSKKDVKSFMKERMKNLLKLKMEKDPDSVKAFKEDSQKYMEWILKNYDDIQFYIGNDFNDECIPAIVINKGEGSEEGIHMYCFRHAMETEKF